MRLTVFLAAVCAFAVPAMGVTFTEDVAPILMENCVQCHRPGEVAPMSLLTYDETRPWAKSIKKVIANGDMPPWHADPRYGTWANDMRLTDAERETLIAWVDEGVKRGPLADMPPAPEFGDSWKLGEPDYVIELPTIDLPATGDDIFPTYVVELDLGESRWINGVEYRPGDRRVVHHILAFAGDAQMGSSEYDVRTTTRRTMAPPEQFGVWVAGAQPVEYPEGMGRTLQANQIMTFNMHYHLAGEATSDTTRVGLHFGEGELEKRITTNFAVNLGIQIPPGEASYTESAYHLFDQDSRIISFTPHMHVRGKAVTYRALYPDGREETLLEVPRYDYNWQWIYYPAEPIVVPAGTRVAADMTWDNSAENPANPDPSAEVLYRENTFSEMFVGFMESVPVEGVRARPMSPVAKVTELLADHPAEDSYINTGMMGLPWGAYLPKDSGTGKYYLTMGSVMFTSNVWDLEWNGDAFEFKTTMVTTSGGGQSMRVAGRAQPDGSLEGTIFLGEMEHAENPDARVMELSFKGKRAS